MKAVIAGQATGIFTLLVASELESGSPWQTVAEICSILGNFVAAA
ncbi:MAG TPA: hypothetical protein VH934_01260 [Xanthobacteraceae bacterium]|jgi:hypothetical protein